MSQNFYHAFEQAFRGSREEIAGRLERGYGAFLRVIAKEAPGGRVLDLGCGRGEWLELALSYGFSAHGVDLDEGMLAECFVRGLPATNGDAIAYLAGEPDDSLSIVSGFHIAEHLPFDVLQEVFRQAMRALRPGGLLILETPNAENLHVGSLSFHMDPTHNKPLPPGLMSFLARYYGFARAEILRLQESPGLSERDTARLLDVLGGVSPDYALVAQKSGPEHVMASASVVFAVDRGLTLDTLSSRFEASIEDRSVERAKRELRDDLAELRSAQHAMERRLEDQAAELRAVYESTSWRVSAPVRAAGTLVQRGRSFTRRILRESVQSALKLPHTRWLARKLKLHFPGLFTRAQRLIYGDLRAAQSAGLPYHQLLDERLLSPRATSIYLRLSEKPDSGIR
ncbi:methyltransferase domain-containing protein [Devosia sp. RR2S18]|uniref:methyltransferase domain-containing protein n=1 Tax=Devosia rhizosphaerae TaxID=3049774 RepID=UPI002540B030|nr:methyltransferase domain-containing protein [Devosia sp. RR2S18]WIJ24019.1 methyltransferase domain-containing protein [Devosia sp. RR2S18]